MVKTGAGLQVIKSRRLLVCLCIAVLVVTAMVPAAGWAVPTDHSPMWSSVSPLRSPAAASPTADLLFDVVASLGPLFGAVVSVSLYQGDVVDLGAVAFLSVRSSRAPPIA
jgi:hypothetical protein